MNCYITFSHYITDFIKSSDLHISLQIVNIYFDYCAEITV